MSSTTDAFSTSTYYTYDAQAELDDLGLPVFGNMTSVSSAGNTTNLTYDAAGNVTEIAANLVWQPGENPGDPGEYVGATTQFEYNEFGEVEKTIDPQGVERGIAYDLNGNQTGTSFTWANPDDSHDQRQVATSNAYDANDQNGSSTTPQGTTSTEHDIFGRPFRTTDQSGNVSETTYDKRGLTIETRRQPIEAPGVTLYTRTVYDELGRAADTTDSFTNTTPVAEITGTRTNYDDDSRVIETQRLKGLEIAITVAAGALSSSLIDEGTVVSSTQTTGKRVVYFDNGSFGDDKSTFPALTGGVFTKVPTTFYGSTVVEKTVGDIDNSLPN